MIKAKPAKVEYHLYQDHKLIREQYLIHLVQKLLDKGICCCLKNGSSKLERIQGAYISDDGYKTNNAKSRKAVDIVKNII